MRDNHPPFEPANILETKSRFLIFARAFSVDRQIRRP
jgi:hypothetical protein